MFRNYLITALRNIARHKLYSFINIAGLAVGLACAIFIILFVRDEISYDKWIPGSENLYRIEITYQSPGRHRCHRRPSLPIPMPWPCATQIPGSDGVTRLTRQRHDRDDRRPAVPGAMSTWWIRISCRSSSCRWSRAMPRTVLSPARILVLSQARPANISATPIRMGKIHHHRPRRLHLDATLQSAP